MTAFCCVFLSWQTAEPFSLLPSFKYPRVTAVIRPNEQTLLNKQGTAASYLNPIFILKAEVSHGTDVRKKKEKRREEEWTGLFKGCLVSLITKSTDSSCPLDCYDTLGVSTLAAWGRRAARLITDTLSPSVQ